MDTTRESDLGTFVTLLFAFGSLIFLIYMTSGNLIATSIPGLLFGL